MAETRVYLGDGSGKRRGGGGVGASLFRDAVFDKFLVSVNRDVLKNCAVNVIEMHSVIIHTYIDNQSKKINRSFGQTTLTVIWWLDLTSLSSLLM